MNEASDISETIMSAGKEYLGKPFCEIPSWYLEKALDWYEFEERHPILKARIEEYLSKTPIQRALEKERKL